MITNGGDQPNVVPPNATVWYYFREADYDHIMNLWHIGDNMAQAATLMTDTTYTSRLLGSAWPGHFNKPIAEAMYENIKKVGLPQWSDDDQTLAKALQKELKVPVNGLADQDSGAARAAARPTERGRGRRRQSSPPAAAPTISAMFPGTCPRSRCAIRRTSPGGPGHNWANGDRHGHADRAQRRGRRARRCRR